LVEPSILYKREAKIRRICGFEQITADVPLTGQGKDEESQFGTAHLVKVDNGGYNKANCYLILDTCHSSLSEDDIICEEQFQNQSDNGLLPA
jgi:endonuclease IV